MPDWGRRPRGAPCGTWPAVHAVTSGIPSCRLRPSVFSAGSASRRQACAWAWCACGLEHRGLIVGASEASDETSLLRPADGLVSAPWFPPLDALDCLQLA